jgi:tRNA (guanine-N7-)-methyltransferase
MDIDNKKYPMAHRFRHHTMPNSYFPIEDLNVIPESYPPLYESIDWTEHFEDGKAPKYLDVGCAKGKFLLDYSEIISGENILGIEIRKAPVEWVNGVIKGEKLDNVSTIWYSVVNGLKFLEEKSIKKVFYLFPDPWSKKKHMKRRALNEKMLDEYSRVFTKEGELYLATDLVDVHDYHKELIEAHPNFEYREIETDQEWGLPITNKEMFCVKQRIPYYRLICKKI